MSLNFNSVLNKAEEPATIYYNGEAIVVKRMLSLKEVIAMVEGVSETCFDQSTGDYHPENKDFAIRHSIFKLYTDVELPDDVEQKYDFVYKCDDLINAILEEVNKQQFNAICRAIDDKIRSMVNANVAEFKRNVDAFTRSVDEIGEKMNEVFEGVSKDDLKNIINILSGAAFDMEKKNLKKTPKGLLVEP